MKEMKKETRLKVYRMYDGHCAYCGRTIEYKDMQVDHIVPKNRGMYSRWDEKQGKFAVTQGEDSLENYMPACRACNFRKRDMKIKNLPKKIYLNICSNEDEVDYNELNGVTFSTEKIGVTDCDTENVPYVNAASLWHDLKEEKPPLKKWVMFRYSGGGVNPTALHYGAMSDDVWLVTRGDGTQRIEVLYECYEKIEWLDFDELK